MLFMPQAPRGIRLKSYSTWELLFTHLFPPLGPAPLFPSRVLQKALPRSATDTQIPVSSSASRKPDLRQRSRVCVIDLKGGFLRLLDTQELRREVHAGTSD